MTVFCTCDHPYLISLLFPAIPTSCYIFNVFYYLLMSFISSRRMPELRFAITQPHMQGSIHGPLTRVLATMAVLAEESLTQAPFKHRFNPFLDGKQSQLSLSEDQGTHRSRHSNSKYFTYSFRYIHIYVRDLLRAVKDGSRLYLYGVCTPAL